MKILFVCTGNACRSPVAEALLKKIKPTIEVDSAGTHAYHKIVEITQQYVEMEKAKEHLKKVPEGLDAKRLNQYDLIIAMEPKHKFAILRVCPKCEAEVIVWNVDDPYLFPQERATEIFAEIKSKVTALANAYG